MTYCLNSLLISYVRVFWEDSAILKSMIEEIFRGKQISVTLFLEVSLTVCALFTYFN